MFFARAHEELPAHKGGLQRFGDMYLGMLHPVSFGWVGCRFHSWLDVVAFSYPYPNPHPCLVNAAGQYSGCFRM